MTDACPAPFAMRGDASSRVVATAIHAGHDTRPEVAALLALDEADRLREEDPYTDRIANSADFQVVVARSRFEVDLNRARHEAVYRTGDDAWGLSLWREEPSLGLIGRSLEVYDEFYDAVATHLDQLASEGPFVVFDVHSYNHRRGGPGSPSAEQEGNPDVNVGTGSMPGRWRSIVDPFIDVLGNTKVAGRLLDVRENVRFRGRHFAQWVHERYPTTGCALALEFKKTFMDEWSGEVDAEHLDALTDALRETIPPVLDALREAA